MKKLDSFWVLFYVKFEFLVGVLAITWLCNNFCNNVNYLF